MKTETNKGKLNEIYHRCYNIYKEEFTHGEDFSINSEDIDEEIEILLSSYKELKHKDLDEDKIIKLLLDNLVIADNSKRVTKSFGHSVRNSKPMLYINTEEANENHFKKLSDEDRKLLFGDIKEVSDIVESDFFDLTKSDNRSKNIKDAMDKSISEISQLDIFRHSISAKRNTLDLTKEFPGRSNSRRVSYEHRKSIFNISNSARNLSVIESNSRYDNMNIGFSTNEDISLAEKFEGKFADNSPDWNMSRLSNVSDFVNMNKD